MLRIKGTGSYYKRRYRTWQTIDRASVWTNPSGVSAAKGQAKKMLPIGSELEMAQFEITEVTP
jgi:hypothetical protein